jgi:arylsulfatase A-like enzyme
VCGELEDGAHQRPWAEAGNTPFRRYKVWLWLGGVRVPLIVAWPGQVSDAGAIRRQHIDVIDIAPTLAEAAGTHLQSRLSA